MSFQNFNENSSCGDKVIVLDLNNLVQICTAKNVYVKSSYRFKIVTFKLKMQKQKYL